MPDLFLLRHPSADRVDPDEPRLPGLARGDRPAPAEILDVGLLESEPLGGLGVVTVRRSANRPGSPRDPGRSRAVICCQARTRSRSSSPNKPGSSAAGASSMARSNSGMVTPARSRADSVTGAPTRATARLPFSERGAGERSTAKSPFPKRVSAVHLSPALCLCGWERDAPPFLLFPRGLAASPFSRRIL